jgi:hypothetical protein
MRAVLCQIDAITDHAIVQSARGDMSRANLQRLIDKFEMAAHQIQAELQRRGPSFGPGMHPAHCEDYTDGGAA